MRQIKIARSTNGDIVPAYWATVQIVGTDRMGGHLGQEVITQFRVDTGADLTSISRDVYNELKAETSHRKVDIRTGDGRCSFPRVVYASLVIDGLSYTPWRGVIVTRSPHCFLGMDILDRFDLLITGDTMLLEPNDQPEVKT